MPAKNARNVSLTAEQNQFVDGLLASGRYGSASEVVRESLRLLEQAERRRLLEKWLTEGLTSDERAKLPANALRQARSEIQAKIQEGLDALDRGDTVDGEKFFARWRRRISAASGSIGKASRVRRRA